MSPEAKIWFIDENPDQRMTYATLLSQIFGEEGQVIAIEPRPTKEEMKSVIDDPNTVSILIDERLKDTGVAQYLGIELAVYFRALNTKMPIYILTTYSGDSDDLDPGKWSVEYVINKDELQRDFRTIKARMLRNISFYQDYLANREARFNKLLKRSLESTISEEEIKEFEELQYIRSKSILADELSVSTELDDKIRKQLEFLSKFEGK